MKLKLRGLILTAIILLSGCSNNPEQTTFQEYPDYSDSSSLSSNNLKELYKKYIDEGGTADFDSWKILVYGEDDRDKVDGYSYVDFVDGDGNIIYSDHVENGSYATYRGEPPTKKDKDENGVITKYEFVGWDRPFDNINEHTVIHATFEENPSKYYRVRFFDYDGSLLEEDAVKESDAAEYKAEKPSRSKESTGNQVTEYSFTGWDRSLENITSPVDFIAQYYSETYKGYHVTFLYPDNTTCLSDWFREGSFIWDVHADYSMYSDEYVEKYGIVVNHDNYSGRPRYCDDENNYIFLSWDNKFDSLSEDCILKENSLTIPLDANGYDRWNGAKDVTDKSIIATLKSLISVKTFVEQGYIKYNGHYYFNDENGPTGFDYSYGWKQAFPVEWRCLKESSNKVLVFSESTLGISNNGNEEGTNYENSFLRKKLQYVMKNNVFISLNRVLITKIDNSIETLNNDNCLPSDYTEDLFFPLSYSEVKSTELFPNKRSRANGNYWVTRSPRALGTAYDYIGKDGEIDNGYYNYEYSRPFMGVRPALYFSKGDDKQS